MAASPPAHTLRLRAPTAALLSLPWELPLKAWSAEGVRFVDLPVGPSRHLVRFAVVEGDVLALKELPGHPARREYEALRQLEARDCPPYAPSAWPNGPADDAAILVTRYLARSFQFRRLFMRLPEGTWSTASACSTRIANLLVELHRKGVFWGDCSLANTLLVRDGQVLQAHLVDAETTEIHAQLSDGQRAFDLELAVENVAGDLADLAGWPGAHWIRWTRSSLRPPSVAERYRRLWDELHRADPLARERALPRRGPPAPPQRAGLRGRRDPASSRPPTAATGCGSRWRVGGRRFHAARLRRLTGLEGRRGPGRRSCSTTSPPGRAAAARGGGDRCGRGRPPLAAEVLEPAVGRLREALGPGIDPVQTYCDLLEVRWLLSERAGRTSVMTSPWRRCANAPPRPARPRTWPPPRRRRASTRCAS